MDFYITHDPIDGLPIEPTAPRVMAKDIIAEVAQAHGVSVEEVIGPRRLPRVVRARQEAMCRIRNELGYSLPRTARFFNRDHTCVLWALRGGRPGNRGQS